MPFGRTHVVLLTTHVRLVRIVPERLCQNALARISAKDNGSSTHSIYTRGAAQGIQSSAFMSMTLRGDLPGCGRSTCGQSSGALSLGLPRLPGAAFNDGQDLVSALGSIDCAGFTSSSAAA
jgi:hypothetical protein